MPVSRAIDSVNENLRLILSDMARSRQSRARERLDLANVGLQREKMRSDTAVRKAQTEREVYLDTPDTLANILGRARKMPGKVKEGFAVILDQPHPIEKGMKIGDIVATPRQAVQMLAEIREKRLAHKQKMTEIGEADNRAVGRIELQDKKAVALQGLRDTKAAQRLDRDIAAKKAAADLKYERDIIIEGIKAQSRDPYVKIAADLIKPQLEFDDEDIAPEDIAARVNAIADGLKGKETGGPAGTDAAPMPGAQLAPDGNWYIQQDGQWFLVGDPGAAASKDQIPDETAASHRTVAPPRLKASHGKVVDTGKPTVKERMSAAEALYKKNRSRIREITAHSPGFAAFYQ